MKMVSAAKLKGDEGRRTTAIAFNTWANALNGPPTLLEGATFENLPQKVLIVPMGTDQGLCGGVNTFITRYVKTCVKLMAAQGKECDIALIGDKTRGQLRRVLSDKIKLSLTEVKQPGNSAGRERTSRSLPTNLNQTPRRKSLTIWRSTS